MNNIAFATIKDLRQAIEKKQISSAEVTSFFIERSKKYDSSLHALLEVFDTTSYQPEQNKLLSGIPGIIKDNICIKDQIASCASRMLQNYRAPYDATAIARLKAAGAPLIARANMDEFAMGSSTETSAFGTTQNPWNLSCVPGGSSGGSAVAVAAGLAPWSLGSETGGSVRHPAALCGIVGLKPTYGLISRYGLIAYASSLDQIGIMAHTAYDVATILSVIAGHDDNDSSSLSVMPTDYTANLENMPRGLRIGIVDNALYADGIDPEIVSSLEESVKVFEQLGAHISHVTLPILDYSAAAYFIISRAEAASNLARFDGIKYGVRAQDVGSLSSLYGNSRHDGFGDEVRKRIMVGNYVLSAGHAGQFYENARRVIRLMRQAIVDTFKNVDILLTPTHPVPAFPLGAYNLDKLQMDLQDYFTCPANLVGVPAISVPCGFTKNKLPIGMQLVAPHLREDLLLQAAHAYQQKTAWHTMHPDGF